MIGRNIPQVLAVAIFLGALTSPASAEQDDAKTVTNEAIDRNAEQIATIGDTVYYFGELGMQERESAKFIKGVLRFNRIYC